MKKQKNPKPLLDKRSLEEQIRCNNIMLEEIIAKLKGAIDYIKSEVLGRHCEAEGRSNLVETAGLLRR